MNKKIIAIAFVAAFAVPYAAKLLAKKEKTVQQLKEELHNLDNKIADLEQSMKKSEDLCETNQTESACAYSNEKVSVEGIELARLKRKCKQVQKELDEHADNKNIACEKKNTKSKKDKKKRKN